MDSFVRIYSSRIPAANVVAARRVIVDELAVALGQQPGCRSVQILFDADGRPEAQESEAALVTGWDSLEELRAGVETEAVAGCLLHLLPLVDVGEIAIKTFSADTVMAKDLRNL